MSLKSLDLILSLSKDEAEISAFFSILLMEILAIDAAFRSNKSLAITVVSVIFFPAIFLFVVTAHLLLKLLFRGDVKWISDAIAASLK